MNPTMVEIRPGAWAHGSGALWLRGSETLLIADAHLGYGWAQRRRGQLGPLADATAIDKLHAVIEELQPRRVVFLGDLVHAPKPSSAERLLIETALTAIASQAEIILVRGNHDRGFLSDFAQLPVHFVEQWTCVGIIALHGDRLPSQTSAANEWLVIGHLHPALAIRDNAGASRRVPVFAAGPRGAILPAFSPYAAGWDLRKGLPPQWREYFSPGPIQVVGVSGKRAVRLRDLSLDQVFD
jgi:putative SbcD/Mre11-related phosphoesterase